MLSKCLRHRGEGFVRELLHFFCKWQQRLQEDALSAPCYAVITALRRRALAGRRNAAEKA
jgi:hypothetical protein